MNDYWKDNGIKKPQQIVVCAACRQDGLIVLGARHWDSRMHEAADRTGIKWSGCDQGFIDQFGDFLSRDDAMQVVKDNGQPFDKERNGGSDKELYSEGLY